MSLSTSCVTFFKSQHFAQLAVFVSSLPTCTIKMAAKRWNSKGEEQERLDKLFAEKQITRATTVAKLKQLDPFFSVGWEDRTLSNHLSSGRKARGMQVKGGIRSLFCHSSHTVFTYSICQTRLAVLLLLIPRH